MRSEFPVPVWYHFFKLFQLVSPFKLLRSRERERAVGGREILETALQEKFFRQMKKKAPWKTRIKNPVHSWMWEQKFRLASYPRALPPRKTPPKNKENTITVIDTDPAMYSYSTGRKKNNEKVMDYRCRKRENSPLSQVGHAKKWWSRWHGGEVSSKHVQEGNGNNIRHLCRKM